MQAELVVAQQVGGKDEPESETDLDRNKLRRQMRSFCRGKLADPLTVGKQETCSFHLMAMQRPVPRLFECVLNCFAT